MLLLPPLNQVSLESSIESRHMITASRVLALSYNHVFGVLNDVCVCEYEYVYEYVCGSQSKKESTLFLVMVLVHSCNFEL